MSTKALTVKEAKAEYYRALSARCHANAANCLPKTPSRAAWLKEATAAANYADALEVEAIEAKADVLAAERWTGPTPGQDGEAF
jgi:hypothetical protein